MRQWDIFDFPFPSASEPHPFVVLSTDEVIADPNVAGVNALLCMTQRAGKKARAHHVQLDEADGLDRSTIVSCHVIHHFPKAVAGRRRGSVSLARRAAIGRTLRTCFRLP